MNGHRIYWPEKRTVRVECSVVFSETHVPVPHDEDDVKLEGEEDDDESDAESNPDIPIIPGDPKVAMNAPNHPNEPNPVPPAAPVANEGPHRSNWNRKPSQLVKKILNKTGVTSNKPSDLRKGLATGIQAPTAIDTVTAEDLEEEDDSDDEIADEGLVEEIGAAMAVAMAQISGLELRNLKEATKSMIFAIG